MAADDQVLDDIDAQLDWSTRLKAALPFSWWSRCDSREQDVIALCWPHGATAAGYGWRPGAADIGADLDEADVCVVCERGVDLQTGRPL